MDEDSDAKESVSFQFVNEEVQSVTFTNCDSNFVTTMFLVDSHGNYIQDQSTNHCDGQNCVDYSYCNHQHHLERQTFTMNDLAE